MSGPARYAEIRERSRVQERELFPQRRTPGELELQARWFAGDFGREFTTVDGHSIEIIQFGVWNREAGPDFIDAVVRVGDCDPVRGSIEFDLADRNWETHGHATNPAFDRTVLHVFVERGPRTFFTRTDKFGYVPQVQVDLARIADGSAVALPLARPGRCHAPLGEMPDDQVVGILEAAAQFRLQRKSARLQRASENHGRDEMLFREVAATLGYKHNKLPFTVLAQRLSLRLLREGQAEAEALLFGLAGFLREADLSIYKSGSREYVRHLWELWWPLRDEYQRLILPQKLWRLGGARPLNHPQRRLGALSTLVAHWPRFLSACASRDTKTVGRFFADLAHPFWNFHYTVTSEATPTSMALIGSSRVAEIMANVLVPLFAAEGDPVWDEYKKLTAKLSNRAAETAAARLFGEDPRRPQFMKTVAHQQGLLQIYEDFCLQDDSDCAQCPFPEQMRNWS